MLTKMLSNLIIKGNIAPVFETPATYGLDYEDVSFVAKDGVQLSGWLVKGRSDKIIIQSHFGVQSSRTGYTPKGKGMVKLWKEDIKFLQHVKYLVNKGYSVLMYDFRNHGDSAEAKNGFCTWGPDEHLDLLAAVDFVATHPVYHNASIGLLSICMGCASTTYAYGQSDGLKKYKNIAAIVGIQPMTYPDFMVKMKLDNFVGRKVTQLNSQRTGLDLDQITFIPYVKDITVPMLVVQNTDDEYLMRTTVEQYYKELKVEKEILWLEGIGTKRAAAYNYLTENPEKILYWFDKYL